MYASKEKRNEYARLWRQRNAEKQNAYHRERRDKRRAWALERLGGKCVRCGSQEDLHFDHIDPSTKESAIGKIYTSSLAVLEQELKKCQLLCSSCHRTKTSENHEYRPPAMHGSARMYTKYRCRCEACRLWKRNYDIEWKRRRANQEAHL